MSEVKTEAQAFQYQYICDDCKKGQLIHIPQAIKPGIKKGDFIVSHRCTSCGKMFDIKNRKYPEIRFEPKQNPNVK